MTVEHRVMSANPPAKKDLLHIMHKLLEAA